MSAVTLTVMLDAREARAAFALHFAQVHDKPVVCLLINMPGPHKKTDDSDYIFAQGVAAVREALSGYVVGWKVLRHNTGDEGFFAVDLPPEQLKQRMCALEERHVLGRLFDLDVRDAQGVQIGRAALGYPPRTCLLCARAGAACARAATHRLEDLLAHIAALVVRARAQEEAI